MSAVLPAPSNPDPRCSVIPAGVAVAPSLGFQHAYTSPQIFTGSDGVPWGGGLVLPTQGRKLPILPGFLSWRVQGLPTALAQVSAILPLGGTTETSKDHGDRVLQNHTYNNRS